MSHATASASATLRDRQVLEHQRLQRPPHRRPGQLRASARPPRWCPAATPAGSRRTGTGARSPPASSDATRTARAPAPARRVSRDTSLRSRSGGTTGRPGPRRRPGRPAPPGPAPDVARSPRSPSPSRRQKVVRSGQAKVASSTSGSSWRSCENFHPAEDLDPHPGSDAPTTRASPTTPPTPSIGMSPFPNVGQEGRLSVLPYAGTERNGGGR